MEDAGLLQDGALLDAEERRVVLCSKQTSIQSQHITQHMGRRAAIRTGIEPDLGFGGQRIWARATRRASGEEGEERGRSFVRACVPSSSKSSSFFTTSGCAMAATAVERCARGLGARVDDAARTAVQRGGARAPASLCLAVLRGRTERERGGGGAYRSGEASGMDDGSESGRRRGAGERLGRVRCKRACLLSIRLN